MKEYKVGDIVYIKPLSWYQKFNKVHGTIIDIPNKFVQSMTAYCGKKATIKRVDNTLPFNIYKTNIDNKKFGWTEQMFDENRSRKLKLKKIGNL